MYRLDQALTAAIDAGETIIAPNRQRAAALRFAHAWRQRDAGRSVWATPDVLTWDAWLARELGRLRTLQDDGPALLNPSQADAQWRDVLAAIEDERGEWADLAAQAGALATAAGTLREWLPELRESGPTEETELLQRALGRFDELSRRRGVLQPSLVSSRDLVQLPASRLLFAGVDRLTPRQSELARHFAANGGAVRVAPLPSSVLTPSVDRCVDASAEAFAAGRWCEQWLARDPLARLLVVCGDARSDATTVRDGLLAALPRSWEALVALEGGEPLARQPQVGAALAWLELGIGEIDLATLGSVLLSPAHKLGAVSECARLDAWLRETAPRKLAADRLLEHLERAPDALATSAGALSTALRSLRAGYESRRQGPLPWVERFVEGLALIGYPGPRAADSTEQQARRRWEAALEEYASLQDFIAPEGAADAIARLRELLTRTRHQAATGDAPVTVTAWRDDPVVGYDAIRVLGLAEGQWPEAPRPDPFLPLDAQRRGGLPGASTHQRLGAARQQLAAWRARAASELVLSHAEVEGDIDLAPAALLGGLTRRVVEDRPMPRLRGGGAGRAPAEPQLPPIAAAGQLLSGGVRRPTLQRDCPFRAQAETRLGAEELATPRVGIDPQLRGTLVHAALDHLWKRVRSSTALAAQPAEAWRPAIQAAVDHAFATLDARRKVPPTARELERERQRCHELLERALERERERDGEFVVLDSELGKDWKVAGVRFAIRIDRVDEVAGGALAIIDYKTGHVPRLELLDAAAKPVQLLVYLDALAERDVAALALLRIDPAELRYRVLEDGRAGLPVGKRSKPPPDLDWPQQRERWRADVRELVRQHLEGAAQVQPLPRACERCPLPALCRIDAHRLDAVLEATVDDDVEDANE